jgi:hypothetical protein
MTHSLTIRLNDEAFSRLRQQAIAAGTSPEELAAASLERQCQTFAPVRSEVDMQAARDRFERHFGEVDLGRPTGADNEQIDADLTREYADTHEAG